MESEGLLPRFKNHLPTCPFSQTDESSPNSRTVFPSTYFYTVTYVH